TKRLSSSIILHVFKVIPIIDILTATLDKFASDHAIFPAVHAAAAKGHHVLDKYYSLMDDSIIYCVAMSMFFCIWYKTLYFQCQKWPESWIDTAVSLVHEQWEKHY
ncbi:hypothetical protein K439DRAFT_1354379, partial [Ramaria rubella]